MSSAREQTEEAEHALGFRIRQKRTGRQLSLDELSALTGISKPQLSRIETGDRQPSVGALVQIAKALGTDAGQLLAEDMVRSRTARPKWAPVVGDVEITPAGQSATLSTFVLEIPTAGLRAETVVLPGEASLFVLSGDLRVEDGRRRSTVKAGDVVHLVLDRPFGLSSARRAPVRVSMVVARAG
jgi:transcriptional regulator with XRE-family HTH domain